MPSLKKARHERFAQELSTGKTNKDAYLNAGYKFSTWTHSNCYRLAHKPDIVARVEELLEERKNQDIVTREKLLLKMIRIVNTGSNLDAIRATERICKMNGWDKEKIELEETINASKMMTDVQLIKFLEDKGELNDSTGDSAGITTPEAGKN